MGPVTYRISRRLVLLCLAIVLVATLARSHPALARGALPDMSRLWVARLEPSDLQGPQPTHGCRRQSEWERRVRDRQLRLPLHDGGVRLSYRSAALGCDGARTRGLQHDLIAGAESRWHSGVRHGKDPDLADRVGSHHDRLRSDHRQAAVAGSLQRDGQRRQRRLGSHREPGWGDRLGVTPDGNRVFVTGQAPDDTATHTPRYPPMQTRAHRSRSPVTRVQDMPGARPGYPAQRRP
jgi:hypothetical protein